MRVADDGSFQSPGSGGMSIKAVVASGSGRQHSTCDPPTPRPTAQGPAAENVAIDVAATLDGTLNHVESLGRPDTWWHAVERRRRTVVYSLFGRHNSQTLHFLLTGTGWLGFTVLITLFCLYGVDVCDVTACSVEARTVVSALLLAVFIVFSLEVLVGSIFVEKYFLSFFFWVDLVGTVSLILDIQWLAEEILNSEDTNALQITRAGRAARVGSQIGRITRVLRILRLFRAVRLLKVLHIRRRAEEGMAPHGLGTGPIRPTVLGELLAESTTRKCVIIILFVLIVATFLSNTPPEAADYNRVQLLSYGVITPELFVEHAPHPVILLSYVLASNESVIQYMPYARSNMRGLLQLRTEFECTKYDGDRIVPCSNPNRVSTVWYDVTETIQLNAGFNIILTSVIIVCLGLSAYFFGKDATTYVILPIETMLKYLKRMIMFGVDVDMDSEAAAPNRKPPETDLLANCVLRLVNEIDAMRQKAEEEARISDTLLNSMVPPRIARRLKELRWWEAGPEQRAQTIADSFPHSTVLFTDIVGFTTLSSRISAEDAMRHLNNMYTVFDEIVEKYGLYKVETIGDSYMLVGGAPEERVDHAERVAAAALEIRATVPLLQEMSGEPAINVRIGMHSGSVTAGVVGFKNPRWHLFGDTCNTASRMESTGIAGEIQLSSTTYELIRERFQCVVRGRIAVKGKGEMVTYLLEREYGSATKRTDSPTVSGGGHAHVAAAGPAAAGPAAAGGAHGGGEAGSAMDREAFLTSPQFKKATERYAAARNSLLTEEEELCKLLATLDGGTAAAAAAAAGFAASGGGEHGGGDQAHAGAVEAVAAAGVVVPRLAASLPPAAFKQLVLAGAAPSDLKALASHLHEELAMARALSGAAEAEKAAGLRRDALLKLAWRVLGGGPGLTLRDTFAAVLDALYKVIECDVIKLYVVDHARGQLWPASRHSAADATKLLPLDGTLAGACVLRGAPLRVEDVARAAQFNAELEELPAGYTSKSMMCVPVFGHPGHGQGHGAGPGGSPAATDVTAVIVAVNRWTSRDHEAEEGARRIVPFSSADEAALSEAAGPVGLLLSRRRGEVLLAAAAGAAGAAGGGPLGALAASAFAVAALPASVAAARMRRVARRSSTALLDTRGNPWAMKQEELLGQARDVLLALCRHLPPEHLAPLRAAGPGGAEPHAQPAGPRSLSPSLSLSAGGAAAGGGGEALVCFLVRCAGEQGAGEYFNLSHSVSVLQGIYLTLRGHPELAGAMGPQQLLALVLAACMVNVAREGEAVAAAAAAAAIAGGGGAGRTLVGASSKALRQRGSAAGQGQAGYGARTSGGSERARLTASQVQRAAAAQGGCLTSDGEAGGAGGGPAGAPGVASADVLLETDDGSAANGALVRAATAEGGGEDDEDSRPLAALRSPRTGTRPSSGAGQVPAGRSRAAMSARRSRLTVVVDGILSGDSNILAPLPAAEAAAVRASVVALLALRNQPAAVLAVLRPLARSESRTTSGGGPRVSDGGAAAALQDGANGGAAVRQGGAAGGSPFAAAGSDAEPAAGHTEQPVAAAEAPAGEDSDKCGVPDGVVPDAEGPVVAGDGGSSVGGEADPPGGGRAKTPVELLLQAHGTEPAKLADARTAVSALLLLAWSDSLHVRDTAMALSLLAARGADARAWASKLAPPPNTSRRRGMAMLSGGPDLPDDVPGLLLLEVPRIALEVQPLWGRVAELLPGLTPQLEALAANRAAYVAMLQDATSTAAAAPRGPTSGSDALAGPNSATGEVHTPALGSMGSAGSRSSGLRSLASGSLRAPRRFTSVKYRSPGLTVVPSGDSTDSAAGAGLRGGFQGGALVRASSSRSHVGHHTDDHDSMYGPASPEDAAPAPLAAARSGRLGYQSSGRFRLPETLQEGDPAAPTASITAGPHGSQPSGSLPGPSPGAAPQLLSHGSADQGLGPGPGPVPHVEGGAVLSRRASITHRLNNLFTSFRAVRRPSRTSGSTVAAHIDLAAVAASAVAAAHSVSSSVQGGGGMPAGFGGGAPAGFSGSAGQPTPPRRMLGGTPSGNDASAGAGWPSPGSVTSMPAGGAAAAVHPHAPTPPYGAMVARPASGSLSVSVSPYPPHRLSGAGSGQAGWSQTVSRMGTPVLASPASSFRRGVHGGPGLAPASPARPSLPPGARAAAVASGAPASPGDALNPPERREDAPAPAAAAASAARRGRLRERIAVKLTAIAGRLHMGGGSSSGGEQASSHAGGSGRGLPPGTSPDVSFASPAPGVPTVMITNVLATTQRQPSMASLPSVASPSPPRLFSAAPSAAASLAVQHAQHAAAAAAAAASFAAANLAASRGAASDSPYGGLPDGPTLSLAQGVAPGCTLATVAEMTTSGRNSSNAGTPRTGSLANDRYPAAPAGGGGGTAAAPASRFGPAATGGSVTAQGAAAGREDASVQPSAPSRTGPPSLSPTNSLHLRPPGGGAGGGNHMAATAELGASRGAAAKGVWLGLRLAGEAIRSVREEASSAALGTPPGPSVHASRVPSESGMEVTASVAGVAAAALSRVPSRMRTPAASMRRGSASSLQAVICLAEAALAGVAARRRSSGGGAASRAGSMYHTAGGVSGSGGHGSVCGSGGAAGGGRGAGSEWAGTATALEFDDRMSPAGERSSAPGAMTRLPAAAGRQDEEVTSSAAAGSLLRARGSGRRSGRLGSVSPSPAGAQLSDQAEP